MAPSSPLGSSLGSASSPLLPWALLALLGADRVAKVQAHGTTLLPWGRVVPGFFWCPWCIGEHHPSTNPWNTVNRLAAPSTPCMGSERDGPSFESKSFSGWASRAGPPNATYLPGEAFEARILLDADHAGEAAWMLCPHAEPETEECFRSRRVTDWVDVHAYWGGDSSIDHWKDNSAFPQIVTLPSDTPPGRYTLRWLWVCKFTDELFVSCIDIDVGARDPRATSQSPGTTMTPWTSRTPMATQTPATTFNPATTSPPPGTSVGMATAPIALGPCTTSASNMAVWFEQDQWYARCGAECPEGAAVCTVLSSPTAKPSSTTGLKLWPSSTAVSSAEGSTGLTSSPPPGEPEPEPEPEPLISSSTPGAPEPEPEAEPEPTAAGDGSAAPSSTGPTGLTSSPLPGEPEPEPEPEPLISSSIPGTLEPEPEAAGEGSAACSARWADCRATMCCQEGGDQCYEQNAYYAQCRPSCPSDWSCTVLDPSRPRCKALWQQCGGAGWAESCCSGARCQAWSDTYHQCVLS